MIKSNHTLDYCEGCKTKMVRCATCDNNCCNAGYGKGPSGEWGTCPDCPDAYAMQDMYWKDPISVEFAKDKTKC